MHLKIKETDQMRMSEADIKYYEDMSELFNTPGWQHLLEIIKGDLVLIEDTIWKSEDNALYRLQGQRNPLIWLRDLKENTAAQFKDVQKQLEEED